MFTWEMGVFERSLYKNIFYVNTACWVQNVQLIFVPVFSLYFQLMLCADSEISHWKYWVVRSKHWFWHTHKSIFKRLPTKVFSKGIPTKVFSKGSHQNTSNVTKGFFLSYSENCLVCPSISFANLILSQFSCADCFCTTSS